MAAVTVGLLGSTLSNVNPSDNDFLACSWPRSEEGMEQKEVVPQAPDEDVRRKDKTNPRLDPKHCLGRCSVTECSDEARRRHIPLLWFRLFVGNAVTDFWFGKLGKPLSMNREMGNWFEYEVRAKTHYGHTPSSTVTIHRKRGWYHQSGSSFHSVISQCMIN